MDELVNNMDTSDSMAHEIAMVDLFTENIGNKVFILTRSYPFVFIGEIVDVHGDYVQIKVETTPIQELENRLWSMHIHRIEVFYIEDGSGPKIPKLMNGYS